MIETEIDHSVEMQKDKTLDLTIGDNHKIDIPIMDVTIGEEAKDAKIMIIEVTVEKEVRVNFRRNFSNDRNNNRDRNRSRTRERSLTTRRHDRRYHSPDTNSATKNRSASRVTMNRDRIRCFK